MKVQFITVGFKKFCLNCKNLNDQTGSTGLKTVESASSHRVANGEYLYSPTHPNEQEMTPGQFLSEV